MLLYSLGDVYFVMLLILRLPAFHLRFRDHTQDTTTGGLRRHNNLPLRHEERHNLMPIYLGAVWNFFGNALRVCLLFLTCHHA